MVKHTNILIVFVLIVSIVALMFGASNAIAQEEKAIIQKAHDDMVLMKEDAATEWDTLANQNVKYADIYEDFCKTWKPDANSDVFTESTTSVYDDKMPKGTYWKMKDCFVYTPKKADANTKFLVYFAGGSGGWILRQDYPQSYLKENSPNAVMVFYKSGFIYDMKTLHNRTVDIWKAASAQLGVAPQDVVVAGSSNGGYTALTVAANLTKDYDIRVDRVLILDMGNLWMKEGCLLSREEAQPMIDGGTTVYAFSKEDNIYQTTGSRQWLSYGVDTKEVCCLNWDHERITKMALTNKTFSWAIRELDELDPYWYTVKPIHDYEP